ncbi:MAG: hypothetical protein EAZ70_09690 [Runella slithyformis]|nr:MAG: hypothetical protein EAZ80_07590 [Runella slithyformis]TAF25686.1 MAG: hypothetical protein EAZ70_09690 [Runella slithyformis]TAF44083.1 MAG: hypothetical protein EAZ63_12805 [Runella slithyformis]
MREWRSVFNDSRWIHKPQKQIRFPYQIEKIPNHKKMGKRMIRIGGHQVAERVAELGNRSVNVVLKSGHTVYGQFKKADDYFIYVHDNRSHPHILAFTQIDEVIYDQSAGF